MYAEPQDAGLRWVIGLAAGTTINGVDAAVVEIAGQGSQIRARVVHWLTQPYGRELRELLIRTSTPDQGDIRLAALAHRALGELFAATAHRAADEASLSLHQIGCVGCLGHTAWHDGEPQQASGLTLGSPFHLAERTGLTVIDDFRGRDLASGGQGTPIGALADLILFGDTIETRLVLHLGGLAHAVYLPPGCGPDGVLAWEIGPCNVLLDSLCRQASGGKAAYDAGGRHAVQGRQIPELLQRWSKHPYLLRRPPKSLHRSAFAEEFARQTVLLAQQAGWGLQDVLCTAGHFVANTIGDFLNRHLPRGRLPQRIIIAGGGARNGLLWRLLEGQLSNFQFESSDGHGIPAQAKEAVTAAVLACLCLDGIPASVPLATGASGRRILGRLTPGSTRNWQRCLAWMTGQVELVPLDDD